LRAAQDFLRDSEERFRLAMNNVAAGLYTVDLNGLVTYVNPAAEAILGWTNAELLGRKMHDMTHYKHPDGTPFPASDCPGLNVLQKGIELREHEDTFIRKDGSFVPVVFSASPLKKDQMTVGIVVGFATTRLGAKQNEQCGRAKNASA
jgi:PAS domain S-box-containing protein